MELADFLLARISEDYERERGGADLYTAKETAARLRANMRRLNIDYAYSIGTGRPVPYEKTEAAKYADHPDYRDEWKP